MRREDVTFTLERGAVSGVWHHPEGGGDTALILGHGAGGTMHMRPLADFADALAARGIAAVRFNFPYAEAGRKTPDRQPVAEACYRAVLAQVRERAERILAGGKSYGGRIGSQAVAAGEPAAGLVFLGYPLHAPATPDRLRDEHLYRIAAPMLFLQGTRDAFARPDLLGGVLARMPRATLHSVEGGDHSFKVPGRTAAEVLAELIEAAAAWIGATR